MNKKPNVDYFYRTGERYGRLTLTGYSVIQKHGDYSRRFVEAECDCGDIGTYVFSYLQKGSTRSCGCLQKDLLRRFPHRKTHGLRGHQLYKVWDGIKGRCYDKKNNRYEFYGAKGVTMCDEWKYDFKKFFDWAMANGWKPGLTVDRFPNRQGIYEPLNCRMASQRAQRLNRDDLHLVTAFGETKCMMDWILDERCKLTLGGLRNRVGRDKKMWPDIEKAITAPPGTRGATVKYKSENRMLFAFGEEKSLADWLKDERCVAAEKVIRNRLRALNTRWKTVEAILTTSVRKSREK